MQTVPDPGISGGGGRRVDPQCQGGDLFIENIALKDILVIFTLDLDCLNYLTPFYVF